MARFRYSIRRDGLWPTALLVMFSVLLGGCNSPGGSEIEEGRIHVNGIDIYYKMMGTGTPTFVLHGGPGDAHDTMLQFKDLADKYKLIFYDQRAGGRSTGDEDTASHGIENFVEDLEQLRLQLAPGKINIIGGSWGAMLAMNYAFTYPENINSLVLVSSMGVSHDYFEFYQANISANRTPEDSIAIEQITATEDFANRSPETVEKFWRYYFKAYCYDPSYADSIILWIRDTTYPRVEGRYAKLGEFFQEYDIRGDLPKISCPTLILYGDYDPTPFAYIQPLHDSIPNSQLVRIPNAGHWLWVEAPDRILPLIRDFLGNN